MKRYFAILVAIAFVSIMGQQQLHAQTYSLKGRVTWSSGPNSSKGVDGATVRLGPGNYTATTDADGNYSITNIPKGSYSCHVKSAKYNSSTTKVVVVNADKTLDIRLRWHKLAVRKQNGGVGIKKQ